MNKKNTLKLFILSAFTLCVGHIFAQTYNNPGGTITTCTGTFYDTGGAGGTTANSNTTPVAAGNYSNNENITTVFCATAGNAIQLNFSAFNLATTDNMSIYDGSSAASGCLIGTYNAASPGTVIAYSGCITIVFTSNATQNRLGWAATISCVALGSYNMACGSITTCSGNFYDSGGPSANYQDNETKTMTFCSGSSTQSIIFNFTSFSLDASFDFLYAYNGPTVGSPLLGSYSATSPGTLFSTTGGCLTFKFTSDGSVNDPGWAAAISCGTPPNQDCANRKAVCGTTTLNDNNSGAGAAADLSNATYAGCLSQGEHQSSWYSFTVGTSGSFSFLINPTNNCDDYDFGLWGPNPTCPLSAAPARCSVACHSCTNACGALGTNNGTTQSATGLKAGLTTTTEASSSKVGYVQDLNVTAGQTYILMVDNSQTSGANGGFTLTFGGSASLTNCPLLPVDLLDFVASTEKAKVRLEWRTASENNSDYYEVERSIDGAHYTVISSMIKAAGYSTSIHLYTIFDDKPLPGISYYRLKQVDLNGEFKYSAIQTIESKMALTKLVSISPNPITKSTSVIEASFTSELGSQDLKLVVKNILGETVSTQYAVLGQGYNNISIPVSNIQQFGVYFLQVISGDQVTTYKILVQ